MTLPALVAQARLHSPLGPLTAAASAQGLAGLWFDGQKHHPGELDAPTLPEHPVLRAAQRALDAAFSGQAVDLPALDLGGTELQRAVWLALLRLQPGQTCSYAALACTVGRPRAVRAVAAAVGRNPVSVLVPCHRVLGSDGSLTGYAGGLDRKRALLALERPPATALREAA